MALADGPGISQEELELAGRNHSLPLEALRYDITPAGLHYVLTHFDIPLTDGASWRLVIDGSERRLDLGLDDLRAMPVTTLAITLECAGNGRALLEPRPLSQPWRVGAVGTGEWTGTLLAPLLEQAGIPPSTSNVLFTGADHGVQGEEEQDYQRSLPLAEALQPGVLLAWAMNGQPLLPQHGAPLRLVVPGWYGMTSVKWLSSIHLLDEPFDGFQHKAYRYQASDDDPGTEVTRQRPRALMMPPGFPDFYSRQRFVEGATCRLTGRAWSGHGDIEAVEVSTDGGATWEPATLGPPVSPHAWQSWSFDWTIPRAGSYELCCRATDSSGQQQPIAPDWNAGGMGNNAVQRIAVTVRF